MRVRAHRRRLAAKGDDFRSGRGAIRIGDVAFEGGVDHISPTPEVVGGIVHAHHADSKLVSKFHAAFHGVVGNRLAEFVVSVPSLRRGESRGKFLDHRSGRPAPDLAAEKVIEVERFEGIVGADPVPGGTVAKPGRIAGFLFRVSPRPVSSRHKIIVLLCRNDKPIFSHLKPLSVVYSQPSRSGRISLSAMRPISESSLLMGLDFVGLG